ncbi:flagellin [Salinisphaera hydrothermalis]|uniref:flagellin N-terminal helical domain-containing protein n=1 Tax=Salinisphaera hydrothermalis TaxID=563188 RepID=UPI0033414AC8
MLSLNSQLSQKIQTHLNQNRRSLNESITRLASGRKINSAKDDAAGEAISNRMTSRIRGQQQAIKNAKDGTSMAETAESALSEIDQRLQRVRELTVRGINGTMSRPDQDATQAEINLNLMEINRLTKQTEFNGINLLNGSAGKVPIQVGASDGETINLDLGSEGFDTKSLGLKDFTIAGIPGQAHLIQKLQGQALDIPVVSPNTDLSFHGTGLTNPTLVETSTSGYGNQRFIRSGTSSTGYTYYQASIVASHDTATRHSKVSVNAGDELYRSVASVDGVSVTGSNVTFTDAAGAPINNARLVATGTRYFIAEGTGSSTQYFRANVSADPGTQSISAQTAAGASPLSPPSFSPVDKVNGTSTITLDPTNVQVDYTNADHQTIQGALHTDSDGNYFLTAIPGGSNTSHGYRYATVVNSEEKGTLLKVRTGIGDVVTYYKMDQISATTHVPQDHTLVRLKEVGSDFRFKHPDDPLATLDRAIAKVDAKRSELGATENRLGSAIDLDHSSIQNLSAARSRIRDTDYAKQTAQLSRSQIIQQAGTAVLAQANRTPQSILNLLQ